MKFAELLTILFITVSFNTAQAADMDSSDTSAIAYCNEQAALAGIDDAEEKKEFIADCIESTAKPSGSGE